MDPAHPDQPTTLRTPDTRASAQSHPIARLAPKVPVEVIGPAEVRTPRLMLRPLVESDRAEYLRVVNASRSALRPWVPLHAEGESDDAFFDRQLQSCLEGDRTGARWRRIAVLGDGAIAGAFNLNAIARGLEWTADASAWISSELAGRGLGREGLAAMLDYAFADTPLGLGLHRVHGGIDPNNLPSLRLVASLGFTHDPSQRSHLQVGSEWRVHEFYSKRAG